MTASASIHKYVDNSIQHGYATFKYGSIDASNDDDEINETKGEFYYVPLKPPRESAHSQHYHSSYSVNETSRIISTTTTTLKASNRQEDDIMLTLTQDSTDCDATEVHDGNSSENDNHPTSKRLLSSFSLSLSYYFFVIGLGFSSDPFSEGNDGTRNTKASDLRLTMLSNFSTAYNLVSISLALTIMEGIYDTTPQDKSLCSSALIAGMIVGQLLGGIIGDVLGRHMAMAVVISLQVVGAVATAFSCDYSSNTVEFTTNIYVVLASWRFLLGLGCGGVYPLAATITAESNSDSNDKVDSSKLVALSFSMQGVGYCITPVIGWVLVSILDEHSDLAWRLLLGFGALPGLYLMLLRLKRQIVPSRPKNSNTIRSSGSVAVMATPREVPVSVVDAIMMEDNLIRKLLGTAGCWFIFDVLFYANVLFQPVVLSAAFGPSESIRKTSIHTVIVSSMALPGYFVSVILIGKQSPRSIQAQGFLMMGLLYCLISVRFHQLSHETILMIALYGSTFFFSNYGPNATTYVLPSMTFSKSCRSTMNGVCAASGKAGALLGTVIFAMAADRFGQQVVMVVCATLSFVGAALTQFCVSEGLLAKSSKEEDDREAAKRSTLTMKVVWSEPSLIDYCDAAS
jgi:PHS family inorganic phosphate transporter-like MFS transporter